MLKTEHVNSAIMCLSCIWERRVYQEDASPILMPVSPSHGTCHYHKMMLCPANQVTTMKPLYLVWMQWH